MPNFIQVLELFRKPAGYLIGKALVQGFGSVRDRERWGCLYRPYYAYGLLRAADVARFAGRTRVTVCEFGVARGAGLLNLIELAEIISPATGVSFRIVGFDTGAGLPPVTGHKNHPEIWAGGDFSMVDPTELMNRIAGRAELILGDVDQTIEAFTQSLTEDAPLGWISIDEDTYSGTVSALRCLNGRPEQYTPAVGVYLDDIGMYVSNRWCGELAAIEEFNEVSDRRKIDMDRTLPGDRPTGPANWHSKMFACHILDHPMRSDGIRRAPVPIEQSTAYAKLLL
jgi:hypothetical protein